MKATEQFRNITGWLKRRSWLVAAAVIMPLAIVPPLAGGADDTDPQEILVEHPLWVRDRVTGKAHRVADLEAAGISALKAQGAGKFAAGKPAGETPASIYKVYSINEVKENGAGQVIALVSAFDYPTAAADLKVFSRTFRLKQLYGTPGKRACTVAAGPHPCFQVIYATGVQPPVDGGWAFESALDTQWAHAIAPGADILLVEAASNFFGDLLLAVDVAVAAGASVVSMSWGAAEIPPENLFDHHFNVDRVTFLAGTGDSGNPGLYPAFSPYVFAVGGTSINRDKKGRFISETAWSGSGGGISQFLPIPGYQLNFPIPDTGGKRGTPDVAFNADPAVSGQAVYDTTPFEGQTGWFTVGGTSISSPQWAGLIARANQARGENLSSNNLARSPLYDAAADDDDYEDNYRDIKVGSNGTCGPPVCTAVRGYDFVTGLGSPHADHLVPFLGEWMK